MGKRKKRKHPLANVASKQTLVAAPSKRQWLWPLVLFLAAICVQYIFPNSDTRAFLYTVWLVGFVMLCLIWLDLWARLNWRRWAKVGLIAGSVLILLAVARWNITTRLRPSFTFIVPGVVLNGDTWDFIANHRGPKSSENVEILFTDEDRKAEVIRTRNSLSLEDLNSYQTMWKLPEVNPMGRGSIFAQQFLWKPFNLSFSHFTAEITWSEGSAHEDLRIARVDDKWQYAMRINDRETGATLIDCNDKEFPNSLALPACFPDETLPGK